MKYIGNFATWMKEQKIMEHLTAVQGEAARRRRRVTAQGGARQQSGGRTTLDVGAGGA